MISRFPSTFRILFSAFGFPVPIIMSDPEVTEVGLHWTLKSYAWDKCLYAAQLVPWG